MILGAGAMNTRQLNLWLQSNYARPSRFDSVICHTCHGHSNFAGNWYTGRLTAQLATIEYTNLIQGVLSYAYNISR
jgi:hypothetical protein